MLPQRKLRVLLLLRFLRRHHTEILHDLTRQDQSRNGRNKRDTSRNCAALGAFMLCARRADAVAAAADGHVFNGPGRNFVRIDDLQMLHAAFSERRAHHARQRAAAGLVDIGYAKASFRIL